MLLATLAESRLQTGALQHPLPSLSCPVLALFHKSPAFAQQWNGIFRARK